MPREFGPTYTVDVAVGHAPIVRSDDVFTNRKEQEHTPRITLFSVHPLSGEHRIRNNPPRNRELLIAVTEDDDMYIGYNESSQAGTDMVRNVIEVLPGVAIKTFVAAEIRTEVKDRHTKAPQVLTIYQYSPRDVTRSGEIKHVHPYDRGLLDPKMFLDSYAQAAIQARLRADEVVFTWGQGKRDNPLPYIPFEERAHPYYAIPNQEEGQVQINEHVKGVFFRADPHIEPHAYERYRETENATFPEWMDVIAQKMRENFAPKRNKHRPYNLQQPVSVYYREKDGYVYMETTPVREGHDYLQTSVAYDDTEFISGHLAIAHFTTVQTDVRLALFDKFSAGGNLVTKEHPQYTLIATLMNRGFTPIGSDGTFLAIER